MVDARLKMCQQYTVTAIKANGHELCYERSGQKHKRNWEDMCIIARLQQLSLHRALPQSTLDALSSIILMPAPLWLCSCRYTR